MMTQEELNALVVILNRTPMTPGEALWVQALIERLRVKQPPAPQVAPPAMREKHDS